MADILLPQVEAYVKRHSLLRSGDRVLVAVSGGPDSVALLHLLTRLQTAQALQIHVAHVDHGLRVESSADAKFVQQMCHEWDIPISVVNVDVRTERRGGESTQQAARRLRMAALRQIARDVDAQAVALGHHRDDQAETVLLRLLRGSGTTGLGGMRPQRGPFIRPLLDIRRVDIEQYCAEYNLNVLHDPSNASELYVRNRIRRQLLPLLKSKYNPNVIERLARAAELLQEDDALLASMAAAAYERAHVGANVSPAGLAAVAENSGVGAQRRQRGIVLLAEAVRGQPEALRRRIVRRALREAGADLRLVTSDHTGAVVKLLDDASAGALTLPGNLRVGREQDLLVFGGGARVGLPSGADRDVDPVAGSSGGHRHRAVTLPEPPPEREVHVPGRTALGDGVAIETTFSPMETFGFGESLEGESLEGESSGSASSEDEPTAGRSPGSSACEGRTVLPAAPALAGDGSAVLAEVELDRDSLRLPLFVRSRASGDRMRPVGLGGAKKLQDIFVDEKVPRYVRDKVPIICDQVGIIWIPGLRVDERAAAGLHTRNTLYVRVTSL